MPSVEIYTSPLCGYCHAAKRLLTDKGVSFATNGAGGVCVLFHEPVRTLDPTGRLRHPGATLTVQDPARLQQVLEQRTGP